MVVPQNRSTGKAFNQAMNVSSVPGERQAKVMSSSQVKKLLGEEKFYTLAEMIFEDEDEYANRAEHVNHLMKIVDMPVEAAECLVRYAVDNDEIGKRLQTSGFFMIIAGLVVSLGGPAICWLTMKIGFVFNILFISPIFGVLMIVLGLKQILTGSAAIFRKNWMKKLMAISFLLSLFLGLAGFIYYLAVY